MNNDFNFHILFTLAIKSIGKTLANFFSRIEFLKPRIGQRENIIFGSFGDQNIGKMLLEKYFVFANVKLDVETDTPWKIQLFSKEVERAINGLDWLNDLSALNGHGSREKTAQWIEKFPFYKVRKDILPSTDRLRSISKNFLFLKSALNKELRKKIENVLKVDFLYIKILRPFVNDVFERLHLTQGLIISSYILDVKENKIFGYAKLFSQDLKSYLKEVEKGLIRNPQEILDIYLMAMESQLILSELKSEKIKQHIRLQRETTNQLATAIRYLQFNNGNLVSAHGGSVGRYRDFMIYSNFTKNSNILNRNNIAGFEKIEGGRLSILIDTEIPRYGKKIRNAHAGFSSFELNFGQEPIFVNCGGGSRFGVKYRKYCQSSKAHNVLLVNHKSQCSFARKFWGQLSDYYLKSGPKKISIEKNKTLTRKSLEIFHDAYSKDYGVNVGRKISADLSGTSVEGLDFLELLDEKRKDKLKEYNLSVHFHIHHKMKFRRNKDEILFDLQSGHIISFIVEGAKINIEDSIHIDDFYEPHKTKKIVLENLYKKCDGKIKWSLKVV